MPRRHVFVTVFCCLMAVVAVVGYTHDTLGKTPVRLLLENAGGRVARATASTSTAPSGRITSLPLLTTRRPARPATTWAARPRSGTTRPMPRSTTFPVRTAIMPTPTSSRNHPTDGRAQPLRKLRGVRAGLSGAAQAEQPQPIRGVRSARTLPCRAHRILSGVRPLRVCLHRPAPRPPVHPPRQAQACGDGAGQGTGRTEDEATLGRKSQKGGSAF